MMHAHTSLHDPLPPLEEKLTGLIDDSDLATWIVTESETEFIGGIRSHAVAALHHGGIRLALSHHLEVCPSSSAESSRKFEQPLRLEEVYQGTVTGGGFPPSIPPASAHRLFEHATTRWRSAVAAREGEIMQDLTTRLLGGDLTGWHRRGDSAFRYESDGASADLSRKERSWLLYRRETFALLVSSLQGPRFEFIADENAARTLFTLLDRSI